MAAAGLAAAQHYQTDFPPEEFKARWARVFDAIGPDAAAVLQGVSLTNGYTMPRQHNTFYYLCGIETPGAYLLLDGRTRKVTLYLPPQNAQLERAEGKVLSAADAALVQKLTGVDQVLDSGQMKEDWPGGAAGTPRLAAIYAEFEPAEAQGQSRGELRMGNAAITNDPWDGRLPRESRFVELVRLRNARAEIRNLSPILDDLRAIKSAREIALIRRASQLAGLGLMEAMRSTEAGRLRVPARRGRALRLPGQRREARGVSLDHRRRHREHQQHALLPQHAAARGRRPRADGLRARLPLLRQRHRPRVAGERHLRARGSASCCSSRSTTTRPSCHA